MDTAGIAGFSMTGSQTEFRRFNKVPLEGNIRLWKEDGLHKEPAKNSYDRSVKLNGHHIVFSNPDNFDTIIACVNCKRGIEVEEPTVPVKKYIFGYFFEHSCS